MHEVRREHRRAGRHRARAAALAAALHAMAAAAAAAGGFSLGSQGAKAAGMAGAFVARADDASALYYNVAGLALLPDRQRARTITLGASATQREESLYQGLPPGIGAGTTAAQDQPTVLAGHGYLVHAFSARVVGGVGVYSPYAWETEWVPEGWAGRFVADSSRLTTYDVAPAIAFRLAPRLALGFGANYRSSEIRLGRRLSLADPSTGEPVDVADFAIDTDTESALGWNAGLLARLGGGFSLGLAYRSGMEIDYLGVGRATQIVTGDDQLDALVAATLPLDQDLAMRTALEYPDSAAVGLSWRRGRHFAAELDAEWTGWSRVEGLAVVFPDEARFDSDHPLLFDDTVAYRLGAEIGLPNSMQLRFGVAREESPQPDATVGPLLVDADRLVLAAGWGWDWLDLAFQWHEMEQRIVSDQLDGLNGNYRNRALALVVTVAR